MALTAEQVALVAKQAGFSGGALATAVAVAMAESGGRPDAIGDVDLTERGEKSVGLWQVNYRPSRDAGNPTRDPVANLDPNHNAAAAYAISARGSRWSPWSTYTSGAYKQYLDTAKSAAGAVGGSGTGGGGFGLHTLTGAVSGAAGAVAGAAGAVVDTVTGGAIKAVKTTGDALVAIGRLVAALLDPANWRRMALVLAGVAVMTAGFTLVFRDVLGPVVADAAKASAAAA